MAAKKKRPMAGEIADAIAGDLVAQAKRKRFATQGVQRVTNRGNSRKRAR